MLSEKMKKKIRNNWYDHKATVWGRYHYKFNEHTGKYYRCASADYNREWLANDGNAVPVWKEVL